MFKTIFLSYNLSHAIRLQENSCLKASGKWLNEIQLYILPDLENY